jgi:hypothetical protein
MMSTRFTVIQEYASPSDAVLAMLTDENYARIRAERTGSDQVSVRQDATGDGTTLVVERVLPAQVPGFAKSLVGDVIRVTEEQVWSDDATAQFTATFNAPMSAAGTITVEPVDAQSSLVRIDGEVKASVPLIGGKLEGLAREQFERYLNAETAIGAAWLAGER